MSETATGDDSYFLKESDQAWSHYRHLETTRFQYTTLFFTGLFAGYGYIVNLFVTKGPTPNVFVATAVILTLLDGFALFLYTVVIRINHILEFYARVIDRTRFHFMKSEYARQTWHLAHRQERRFAVSANLARLAEVLLHCFWMAGAACGVALVSINRMHGIYQWFVVFGLSVLMGRLNNLTISAAERESRHHRANLPVLPDTTPEPQP